MEWLSQRRLGLVIGLVLTFVSLAALFSFAPQDPTLTNLRFPKDGVGNWMGYPGALAGGSLVEAFGWAALALPGALLYWTLCRVGRPRGWKYSLQTLALALVGASWIGQWSDTPGLGLASPGLIGWSGGQWTRGLLGPWLSGAILTAGLALALWHQFYAPQWRAALSDIRTLGKLFTREGWRQIAAWLRGGADGARGMAPTLGLVLMAPVGALAWAGMGIGDFLRYWIVAPVARVIQHVHMSATSLRRVKARAAAATVAQHRAAQPRSAAAAQEQAASGQAFDAWMKPDAAPAPIAVEPWIEETGAPPRSVAHPSALSIEPAENPDVAPAPLPIPRALERQPAAQPTGAERLAAESHTAAELTQKITREVESLRPARPELPPAGAGAERWEQLLRRYRENLDLDWDERSWRAKEDESKNTDPKSENGKSSGDSAPRRTK